MLTAKSAEQVQELACPFSALRPVQQCLGEDRDLVDEEEPRLAVLRVFQLRKQVVGEDGPVHVQKQVPPVALVLGAAHDTMQPFGERGEQRLAHPDLLLDRRAHLLEEGALFSVPFDVEHDGAIALREALLLEPLQEDRLSDPPWCQHQDVAA